MKPTLADFAFAKQVQKQIRTKLNKLGMSHLPNLPLRELTIDLMKLRLTSTITTKGRGRSGCGAGTSP